MLPFFVPPEWLEPVVLMLNEHADTSFASNRTSFEISNYKISAYQFHTTY